MVAVRLKHQAGDLLCRGILKCSGFCTGYIENMNKMEFIRDAEVNRVHRICKVKGADSVYTVEWN